MFIGSRSWNCVRRVTSVLIMEVLLSRTVAKSHKSCTTGRGLPAHASPGGRRRWRHTPRAPRHVALATAEEQVDGAIEQGRQQIGTLREFGGGAEERRCAGPPAAADRRAIAGNEQPVAVFDPLLERDGGVGAHFGYLEGIDGGLRVELAQDAIVVLCMARVHEHDDTPTRVAIEQGARDVDVAVMGNDEHRATRLRYRFVECADLDWHYGVSGHPAHP